MKSIKLIVSLCMLSITLCIDAYFFKKDVKLRVGYWSTFNQECKLNDCGIAMYTQHHLNALAKHHVKTYNYSHKLTVNQILKKIAHDKINVLNIQYDKPVLPKIEILRHTIKIIKKLGVKVIVTIHEDHKDTQQLIDIVDTVICHKEPRFINSKNKKIVYLPMGAPAFIPSNTRENLRKKYGFTNDQKIIITAGFAFYPKQMPDILEKMVPLLKSNPNYRIQILASCSSRAKYQCDKVNSDIANVIKHYQLQDQVIHITDFLNQQEFNERLWISDIGYLWDNRDSVSSSGSSKEFIASRLPLVVNSSSHFHDLKYGVVRVANDLDVFIATIAKTLNSSESLKQLRDQLEKRYQSLNYSNLIVHYIDTYKQLIH